MMIKSKLLLLVAGALLASVVTASAQTNLNRAEPGRRLIDGATVNGLIDSVTGVRTGTFNGVGKFSDITGTDASLAVAGQAAATATGAGGAIPVVGGAGGSTSGAGGAVSVTGGAATAGNSAGGAASLVGGAGQGSAAGGAIAVTGGAAGATGVGGAVAIASGAPTAGNGTDITVTASSGAGSTNAGGSINLVPGAAVSTGIPGTVQVNGNASLMCGSYYFTGTPAATNQVFYVATRPMMVTSISEVHAVAAGGTSTLDITKDTTTGAPASGSALTSAAFNLNATANTVQAGAVTATVATKTLAAGDRLAVKFANAIQSSAGVVVTACMSPL